MELSTPVKFVKRVGERIAANLSERGVETIEDLLYHLPFRYEDRLHPKPINELQPGEMASIIGEVRGTVLLKTRAAPIFEMTVGQGLQSIKCMWFHGTYLRDRFKPGQTVALYGKLEGSRSGNAVGAVPGATRFKMVQPTFEILPDAGATGEDAEFTMLEMGRIVPVYESLGGKTPWGAKLTSRWLRRVVWTIFHDFAEQGWGDPSSPMASSSAKVGSHTSRIEEIETLPRALRERLKLPSRMAALEALHFPAAGTSMTELMSARTPAHRRLIFEEFWYLELGLELKRRRLRERAGTAFVTDDKVRAALKQILPFKPTAAQKRVLGEIAADMRAPRPMRRLLQGDVGSGKTIVALQAALVAIENGYQAALMAPTEILATQHYLSARKLLGGVLSPRTGKPYRITLLTGSLDERAKREARARIFRGEADLAIGTHALVEEKVDFENLGLVIIDEQHRFGVQQRFKLTRKQKLSGDPSSPTASSSAKVGRTIPEQVTEPDVLVMTATPIPRTLALTLYGDLEVSVIDEMPPGRTPIVTRRMPEERSDEVWSFVRKQVDAGRQAYIVYPIIEGEKDDQPELDFATDPTEETLSSRLERSAVERSQHLRPPAPTPELSSRPERSAVERSQHLRPPTLTPELSSRPKRSAVERPASKASASAKSAPLLAPKRRKPTPKKLRSATEMFDELRTGALAGLRLGLLHGRMSADDKEVAMARFKRGEIDVLVATTVIEVGVDVPNATVMVIEHAERFGLAQMHQLRGRVGRGAAKSYCVLLTGSSVTPEAEQRLDAMVRTQNGFELAELDLQQRGPGEFFGTRQAGLPDLRVANLARDRDLLELAKAEATRFVEGPRDNIPREEIEAVWARLKHQWQRRYGLVEA
jgi:ATP-dependent DNA helicase RecG